MSIKIFLIFFLLKKKQNQIPDAKTGKDRVDAVVIDEESVGSVDSCLSGCGGKILRGDGALENYLAKTRSKEQMVWNFTHLFSFNGVLSEMNFCGECSRKLMGNWWKEKKKPHQKP